MNPDDSSALTFAAVVALILGVALAVALVACCGALP